ncbi:hypothetical protein NY590_03495, partial [Enterobacter kobei]
GAAVAADKLDTVDLDHYGEDGNVEGEEEDAVDGESKSSKVAELAKAADAAGGTHGEHCDFKGVVADNANTNGSDGVGDN